MKCSISAGILGTIVGALAGCSGSGALQSRMQGIQINPNTYVVQVGDTIEAIAFRYRMTSNRLAALNPDLTAEVYPGQRVTVRSGRRELAPVYADVRQRREVPASYRPDTDYQRANEVIVTAVPTRENPMRTEQIIEESSTTELFSEPATLNSAIPEKGGWRWPSDGEVVRAYAPAEVNGQGIDIAGVPGQEVRASADGTVIYAGRDLSNSGNLVIIRHAGDVLSTYSHAKDLYVAEDDTVRGGDPIASLGWNSEKESVLHFGIRKNGKPVNPIGFLPDR